MRGDRIIIDKKYVHKIRDENVFLCNLRRALPQVISREMFENDVKNAVTEEEFALLNRHYQPDLPDYSAAESGLAGYVVSYLPAVRLISAGVFHALLEEKKAQWERDLIESLYLKDDLVNGGVYRLKEEISEPFDGFLLSSLNAWDSYINSEERTMLSSALEKVPVLPKRNVFFANMFVNTGHPFFFEHPNDHVPAIMLIETVRQFLLACSHRFGKVPFDDTQIIVNAMNARFLNYVNINYPVLFKSTTVNLKTNKQGFWKYQEVKAEVFQGGKCLAEFTFNGNCISSDLFRAIREDQLEELRQSRFVPQCAGEYRLTVRQPGSGRAVQAALLNVSLEGIAVTIAENDFLQEEELLDIELRHGDSDPIRGRYRLIWHSAIGGRTALGLRSVSLGEDDLKKLYDLICRSCTVEEKREFM